jgi:hypothetical protein
MGLARRFADAKDAAGSSKIMTIRWRLLNLERDINSLNTALNVDGAQSDFLTKSYHPLHVAQTI